MVAADKLTKVKGVSDLQARSAYYEMMTHLTLGPTRETRLLAYWLLDTNLLFFRQDIWQEDKQEKCEETVACWLRERTLRSNAASRRHCHHFSSSGMEPKDSLRS